jgi:hypothetical protein
MGRISNPTLNALADQWSPVVHALLERTGAQHWPAKKERRSWLAKPKKVIRFGIEGPAPYEGGAAWALYHTSRPSTFDAQGVLSEGKRMFWLVELRPSDPPTFSIEGADAINGIPLEERALEKALSTAQKTGPKVETFVGNKGPLGHRR